TPPKPTTPPPTTVCTLNLSGVAPFSLTMQEKNATETHARGQLPAPWLADVYKPASFRNGIPMGEFAVAEVEGAKVFSLKNIEGTFVQFYTARAVGRIKTGSTYTFRIEYRTAGHAHGEIGVRG